MYCVVVVAEVKQADIIEPPHINLTLSAWRDVAAAQEVTAGSGRRSAQRASCAEIKHQAPFTITVSVLYMIPTVLRNYLFIL